MKTEEIIKNLSKALLNWYGFKENRKALFISGGFSECEVLFDVLQEKKLCVKRIDYRQIQDVNEKYDYIVMAGVIEKCKTPVDFLCELKSKLTLNGKILIATDNRFAIRYFCGDKDLFSGHVLDGIDNYRRVSPQRLEVIGGHSYAKIELEKMLHKAKFDHYQFYSVLPCITRPQILLKYGCATNERLDIRVFPQYKSAETVFLDEELLYDALLENDMLHQMANGYLIECSVGEELTEAEQITVQGDRSPSEAFATMLQKDRVLKRPLYQEGAWKVERLLENTLYLKQHKIPVVDAYIDNDTYVMPYVKGQIATDYFRNVLRTDRDEFVHKLEEFYSIIIGSSEHVSYEEMNWREFEPGWEKRKADDPNIDKWEKLAKGTDKDREDIGIILKKGFLDLVSLNCFYTDIGFQFFDQEFYIENLPANAIFIRTIDFIYRDCYEMEMLYPKDDILMHFHLYEHQKVWRRKGNDFLEQLRNEKELLTYHKRARRNYNTVTSNRFRMDYTQEEYDKLFNNIFDEIDNKKIFLFGSGKYSERFIEKFNQYCNIEGIIDNNPEKWGTELSGIPIMGPDILLKQEVSFKVYICIKFYEDVLRQLKQMGVSNISVFDPRIDYKRPMKAIALKENELPKKYHIGYVAGVFDLFHIGHLNLLRRAKEMCDYLIVGVVSDEQVINSKRTSPYISLEERMQIVQACRYVDETVVIPVDRPETEDAWRMYHFDVQFSGSDYENDPDWMAKREYLRQHGAELVFFPYTQSTSSTKLKEKISH